MGGLPFELTIITIDVETLMGLTPLFFAKIAHQAFWCDSVRCDGDDYRCVEGTNWSLVWCGDWCQRLWWGFRSEYALISRIDHLESSARGGSNIRDGRNMLPVKFDRYCLSICCNWCQNFNGSDPFILDFPLQRFGIGSVGIVHLMAHRWCCSM